jgi:hypothetical protein
LSGFVRHMAAFILVFATTLAVSLAQAHSEESDDEISADHDHEHHGHGHEPKTDPGARAIEGLMRSKAQKREKIPSFRAQESLMRRICKQMEEDGRRAEWLAILERTIDTSPEAKGAWRNLLKSWSTNCRLVTKPTPKPKKRSATDEESESMEGDDGAAVPTAVPVKPRALTPGTELLELASEWSVSTSTSMSGIPEVGDAIRSMLHLLRPVQRPKKGPTVEMEPGARIYFDIFAEYLTAPWARMFAEEERKARRENAGSADVNDLFDDR